MKVRTICFYLVFVFGFFGCGEENNSDWIDELNEEEAVENSSIIINEFCYKRNLENEYGKKSDWIELYNTSNEDILIGEGDWSISDNPEISDKYFIPEVTIPAKGYLILYCDGKNKLGLDIHTNFKLKSKGEIISLYYQGELIDQQEFDSIGGDYMCKCRTSDAGTEWQYTIESTPGKSN